MIPAIYSKGKIVTGFNHGDAFSKLTKEEKEYSTLKSGFIDPQGNKFVSEDGDEICLRKIILVRHAKYEKDHITKEGRDQAKKVAAFLNSLHIDEEKFICLSSPKTRCRETAEEIAKECHLKLKTENILDEMHSNETIDKFIQRIKNCLQNLPQKSVIISHCDFIQNLIELTSGYNVQSEIPNCSSTLIVNQNVIFYAKTN